MNTLRVLIAHPDAPDGPAAWALFGATGRAIDHGVGRAAAWPSADRVEAVVAANAVRVASIVLPPLPASRVAAAAAFALEDQLAGPPDAQHLAMSKQASDGRVTVVIAAQRDIAALASSRNPTFARVIAEPQLVGASTAWRWCANDAGAGFVRLPDGSTFPVDVDANEALPPELVLALERARRDGALPREIVVDRVASDTELERWSTEAGVRFAKGSPWRWEQASADCFAAATDLLQGDFARAPRDAPSRARSRALAPAVALAVVAAALYVVAAAADWTLANLEAWRQSRAWSELARAAGLSDAEARDAATAKAAIAKRHAELRHAHGLAAPADALPLLARAAPAFAALPAATVRSATYADDHWTFELSRLDAPTLARLDSALRNAGTPALAATSDAATRVRIGAP